ncbi:MAG: hypothetical protein KatS3mg113_0225 [Planctomycetaceae bacterium]|nr:MAG: hypothetical protein KatS3mg113_0225 [Planctomycetaceae bacterium]
MARSLDQLSFREKLRDAEHRVRDMIDHLEQGLLPRLQQAQQVCRPYKPGEENDVSDITVRNTVASLLEAYRYAAELQEQLDQYAQAIDKELSTIFNPQV